MTAHVLGDPWGGPLGGFFHDSGLLFAVSAPTPTDKVSHLFSGGSPSVQGGSGCEDPHSPGKEGHQGGEAERSAGWVLFMLLPYPQDGRLTLILDLRGLNMFLRPLRCKMLTVPRPSYGWL